MSQENQVGCDSGVRIMNYTLQLRSYGFDQVTLICIGNCVFQQSTACKTTKFLPIRFNHSGLLGAAKMNKFFLSYTFLQYNFEKLIRTNSENY